METLVSTMVFVSLFPGSPASPQYNFRPFLKNSIFHSAFICITTKDVLFILVLFWVGLVNFEKHSESAEKILREKISVEVEI